MAFYKCKVCGKIFEVKDGETPVCPVCHKSGDDLELFTGNPYKYFRLAFTMTIPAEESLTGFSVEYFPKLTHKMR